MLVLTRRTGQSIMIGDNIELKIVDIKGDQVRIAIGAPAAISIHRREVYDQIIAENQQASQAPTSAGRLGELLRSGRPGQ